MMTLFGEIFLHPGPGGDMDPWRWGWGYHMGFFSVIMMAVFWILVIIGIVFAIRWLAVSTRHRGDDVRSEDSALEILKVRYAKGEINKEEFEQRKKDREF